MFKDKKVIIFDMDGTLIDSIGIWNEVDIELIKKIGSVKIENEDIGLQRENKLKEYSETEDAYLEYCGFLSEKYKSNLSKEEIKKLRYEIADDFLKYNIDYKPKADEVIKRLKELNYTLVIASTTNSRSIENYKKYNKNIIDKADLNQYFSLIYIKDDVKELKPNPEVHYKVMNKLNVKPEECLIFEDSLNGVEAAKRANIDVAVIYDKYSDGAREIINQNANYVFNNFEEVLEKINEENIICNN